MCQFALKVESNQLEDNPEFRQYRIYPNLMKRSQILRAIRAFFFDQGFIEIETPYRIPAPAPEANIDAEPSGDWFLHTSPELCMKRLLSAGYSRIFQICKCFRAKERGEKHLPEFTLLEWYCAGSDYYQMMIQCESLIRRAAQEIGSSDTLVYQSKPIDLKTPWNRMTVSESFSTYGSLSMEQALKQGLFDDIFAFEIEPQLGKDRPVFLYDYPSSLGALAKRKSENPDIAERFELYIAGIELCNAFSELTDPVEQRNRFQKELADRKNAGRPITSMPEKFLKSLHHMPEASGNALGVDRLVMLLTDSLSIDEVTAFVPEEL